MKTFPCTCGQTLFYENTRCLRCGAELGFCPVCRRITPIKPLNGTTYHCGNPACRAKLVKCANYAEYDVCNRCVAVPADGNSPPPYCDCCRYNQTIPDLSIPGNWMKWYRLEAAKRRLIYGLDYLRLPHGTRADGIEPPLSFDFKADVIPENDLWHSMGAEERVYTGHSNGHITINIREADEVERERLRVEMGEGHRTLIGHFRHEIGHYYWDMLVRERREAEYVRHFGDPSQKPYDQAMDAYYRNGPSPDWSRQYVTAYASMHPWEDWAETFAAFLDIVSGLETAVHVGFLPADAFDLDDPDGMFSRYQELGFALNEMSRAMGLLDMVPDVLVGPVIDKLRFVHSICREAPGVVSRERRPA